MLGGYGSCGRPLCCTTWLHVVRAGLDQDGEAAEPQSESLEALGDVRPVEVLPALRAAERQGRQARRLRRRRRRVQQPVRARVRHLRIRRLRVLQAVTQQADESASRSVTRPASVPRSPSAPRTIQPCWRSASRSSTDRHTVDGARRDSRRARSAPTAGRAAYDAIVRAVSDAQRRDDRRDRDGADQQGSVRRCRACRGRGTPTCSRTSPARRGA